MALELVTQENMQGIVDALAKNGFRVGPIVRTDDGGCRPRYQFGNRQSYIDPVYYADADGIAAVLDSHILLDYDGNKPGAIPLSMSELKLKLGDMIDLDHPIQSNTKGDSLHFICALPKDVKMEEYVCNNQNRIGPWVDSLAGNQLMFVKMGKLFDRDVLSAIKVIPLRSAQLFLAPRVQRQGPGVSELSLFRTPEDCRRRVPEIERILDDVSPDCPRHRWLRVCMGVATDLYSAPDLAIDVLDKWSRRAPGKYNEGETAQQIEEIVRRNKMPLSGGVMFSSVAAMAREESGTDLVQLARNARVMFSTVDLSQYALIKSSGRYWEVSSKIDIHHKTLDTMYGHIEEFNGRGRNPVFSTVLKQNAQKIVVDGIGFFPSNTAFFDIGDEKYANTYVPPKLKALEGDVSIWLTLMRHIYGEYAELVIDHMAFTVQYPERKIKWQIFLYGRPRTGKTLSLKPLHYIFGKHAKVVDSHHAGLIYDDGYASAKVVIYEEVAHKGNRGIYESLKAKLSNDDVDTLNIKMKGMMMQPNRYSIYMFSNNSDALAIDELGDKLLVMKGPNERLNSCIYEEYSRGLTQGKLSNYVYDFLLKRDVTQFPCDELPVRTQAAVDMSRNAAPEAEQIMREWLTEEAFPFMKPRTGNPALDVMSVMLVDIRNALRAEHVYGKNISIRSVLEQEGYIELKSPIKHGYGKTRALFVHESAAICGAPEARQFEWMVYYFIACGIEAQMTDCMRRYAADTGITTTGVKSFLVID